MASFAEMVPHSDEDFANFVKMCAEEDAAYKKKIDKKGLEVWIKSIPGSSCNQLKFRAEFDFPFSTVYDVLQDTEYREQWDPSMLKCYSAFLVDDNCTVDYYAAKSPGPLKNRDLVTVCTWKSDDKQALMLNRSVELDELPPFNKFVRMKSNMTAHRMTATGPNTSVYEYITHVDPRGDIPKFVVNFAATSLAPKTIKSIEKACGKYTEWKNANNPDVKPWYDATQFKDIPRRGKEPAAAEDASGAAGMSPVAAHGAQAQIAHPERAMSPEGERDDMDEATLEQARKELASYDSASSGVAATPDSSRVATPEPEAEAAAAAGDTAAGADGGVGVGVGGGLETAVLDEVNNLGERRVLTTL